MDRDPNNPDELVDIFLINHTAPVGDLFGSPMQVYSGIYGFVIMSLELSVSCAQNFQDPDCSECAPGFTCQPIDDCLEVNCSGNGQCVDGVDSFNCSCDPGFTGELCQTNIDDCVGVDCSGNGWCVDGIGNFTCNCSAGYTGTECEVNIDECVGVNCSGNGWCVDGIGNVTCNCSAGYTGTECEVNIDDCVRVDCSENGECLDGANSFTCECNPGYTGQFCENTEGILLWL